MVLRKISEMLTVPVEIVQYISQFVDQTPTVYLDLAQVSRSFYSVFMCDKLWRPFDVYGLTTGIADDYEQKVRGAVRKLLHDVYAPNNIVAREEINPECLSERYVQLALASSDGVCLYLHNWKLVDIHRDVALIAVRRQGRTYKFLDQQLQNDREIVLATSCNPVQYITDVSLYNDREVVLSLASRYGAVLERAPTFASDREVMLAAVKNDGSALMYAHPRLLADYTVCIAAGPSGIPYIPHDMPRYREVLLSAIKSDWSVLEHASFKHRDDETIVQAAVAQSGESLRFASDRLRKDRDFILSSGFMAFYFAHPSIRSNKEIVYPLMKLGRCSLNVISPQLQADLDIVLAAVQNHGDQLQYAPLMFKDNNKIVDAAISQNPNALKYASVRCRNDKDLVMAAVQSNGLTLRYASSHLRRNVDIVRAAVKNNGAALRYAGSIHRCKSEIIGIACMTYPDAIRMATPDYHISRDMPDVHMDTEWAADMDECCVEDRFVA